MKRIHIIGRKNSGKTGLVVELVEQLSAMGKRVGTVKHTHHQHELDVPGKDSYRHRQAGAAAVAVFSPNLSAVFRPTSPAIDHDGDDTRYDEWAAAFEDCDLVLVEGHSQSAGIKIEVWRAAVTDRPMACDDPSITAVITDDELDIDVPVWSRTNLAELANAVLKLPDAV